MRKFFEINDKSVHSDAIEQSMTQGDFEMMNETIKSSEHGVRRKKSIQSLRSDSENRAEQKFEEKYGYIYEKERVEFNLYC